jgi:aryl-alcohol dehydrogenase-like predicted oxidoreductase
MNSMNKRDFSGRAIGEMGMGCWQLGGDWGAIREADALLTLQSAYENGVNFFDTADVYGGGRSEKILGEFLKTQQPTDVFVATKLGRRGDPGWSENFTKENMQRHTEDSLKNLGVDCLDLTQLHCIPTEVLREGEVFEHLREMQTAGKIRHFGVSVESMEEGLLCLEQPGVTSLQIIFNLFRQKPIEQLLAAAKQKNVALIVRLPLASGLLTGKFNANTTFEPQDHRTYNRDGQAFNVGETFAGLPFEIGVDRAEQLNALVPEGFTLTEIALRWCLDFDAVTVLIPGAKNPEQAKANAKISNLAPLSKELHTELAAFYQAQVKAHIRGPY